MARSSSLDYNKQASELLKGQVDLAGKRVDLLSKKPSDFAPEVDLFKNIQANVQGKRKPAYQAIIEGIMNGAQYGMQKKQSEAEKEKYGEISRVLDYFDQNAQEISLQNQQNMEKEQRREKLEPYMTTGAEIIQSDGDYNTKMNALDGVLRQLKSEDPSIKGDLVGFIPDTYILNMRDDAGQIQAFDLSKGISQETLKLLQDKFLGKQKNAASMKNADAHMMSAGASVQTAQTNAKYAGVNAASREAYANDINNRWDPEQQFNVASGKQQGKIAPERVSKIQEENVELEDVAYDIAYLQDLLKSGNVITGDNLGTWITRQIGRSLGTKQLSDTQLYDATAKSLLKFANNNSSFGNANTKEFEFLTAPVPDSGKTRDANRRLLERFQDKLKKQIARNEKIISKYENFNPYENEGKVQQSGMGGSQDRGRSQGGGSITMIDPETGQEDQIHVDQLKRALSIGLQPK